MARISAVIITHNEERNIGRCLERLSGIADEILVVDSGSTDGTKEIVESHQARFLHHDWAGYSAQKNWANDQATGDYILSLDADEALSPELQKSLQDTIAKGLKGAYGLNRKTNYCGTWINHCGWYPDRKVRLFPKAGSNWEGTIHEELILPPETSVSWLKGDLEHYLYYTEEEHLQRIEKYCRLNAERMHNQGKKSSVLKGITSSISRFIRMYFFQLGFLDGAAGYKVCRNSAYAARLKYRYLRELNANA